YYDSIQGVAALREQVARLLLDSGCQIGPDQLLITIGCQEAISAGLRAVCQPGDIVAVDSPCFHGTMQTLKGLGI
ncbi:aminotransferase class I/II-fold pyridoxal phosphate-dependent enzyme, partial [Klebsiella pneumoniae]|uniref:aminotransferase class I/II-fold pyridoxal phosphate-dependent enzyme n=1 Tax=Klebsiella pneumoniae TaxID=573 RepID=UPI0013D34973